MQRSPGNNPPLRARGLTAAGAGGESTETGINDKQMGGINGGDVIDGFLSVPPRGHFEGCLNDVNLQFNPENRDCGTKYIGCRNVHPCFK